MLFSRISFVAAAVLLLASCAKINVKATSDSAKSTAGITSRADSMLVDSTRLFIRRGMTTEARNFLETNRARHSEANYLALKASSFEKDRNWVEVIAALTGATRLQPDSLGWQSRLWVAMTQIAGKDTAWLAMSHHFIRTAGDEFAAGSALRDCYLAYVAATLIGDSTAEARADKLIQLYPDSKEANDLIGSRFWDGMYPIWTNDSAKVPYFHSFIQKYSASDWAQFARRNLIWSYFALKDTASAVSAARIMVHFSDNDPLVLAQAVTALLDVAEEADTVRAWAERAYTHRDKLTRPSYYSPPEWALIEQATKAGFPLTLAGLHLRVGQASLPVNEEALQKARYYAEESHTLAVYDIDDNNTTAPQHFMLGRIALAEGDSTEAAEWWVEAAMDGDVFNRFAGRAVDSLKAVFGLKDTDSPPLAGGAGGGESLLAFSRETAKYKGITFDRATAAVGLDSARGGRVAWGDMTGRGYGDGDDLLAGGNTLYLNIRGQFVNATDSVDFTAEGCHGGIWADFDGDSRDDIFTFSSSNDPTKAERLFKNYTNGSADFDLVPSPSLPDSFSTEAVIWFDANGDGRLDLYIPGYERPAKGADDLGNAWPSRLMVQDKGGVFHDSTEAFGLTLNDGKWFCARSPVACDFDRDGDQDLYVGNYRLQENQFFVNNSIVHGQPAVADRTTPITADHGGSAVDKGRFTNLAAFYQIDGDEVEGWYGHTIGCEWGDFDGDGDFDLIACNLAHPRYIGFSNRTMLYRNDAVIPPPLAGRAGGGVFTNVQHLWRLKYEECHSEPVWGDFDNDGDLDLFITSVYPNRRSFLFENKGDHFEDVTFLSGVRIFNGWGCATSDYNNDGRLDLAACEGGKVELYSNSTQNANNWIEIAPERTTGEHLSQIGGIVEIESGGRKFIRQFEGGKGAGSQNSGTLHFGIGKGTSCNMTVFNRGKSIRFSDLRANQKFEVGKESVGVGVH